jgi:hypothetical protein
MKKNPFQLSLEGKEDQPPVDVNIGIAWFLHHLGDTLFKRAAGTLNLRVKNVSKRKDKLILHQMCVRAIA